MGKENRISTSYISKAKKLLKKYGSLNSLGWYDLEKLVNELLVLDKCEICPTEPTKDGGVDIITMRKNRRLGPDKILWQIKKYRKSNPVGISIIREMGFLIPNLKASRRVIITTGKFTKGALKLIYEYKHILSGMNGDDIEKWIYEYGDENDYGKDLPF